MQLHPLVLPSTATGCVLFYRYGYCLSFNESVVVSLPPGLRLYRRSLCTISKFLQAF